jgi:hypothetical protein
LVLVDDSAKASVIVEEVTKAKLLLLCRLKYPKREALRLGEQVVAAGEMPNNVVIPNLPWRLAAKRPS